MEAVQGTELIAVTIVVGSSIGNIGCSTAHMLVVAAANRTAVVMDCAQSQLWRMLELRAHSMIVHNFSIQVGFTTAYKRHLLEHSCMTERFGGKPVLGQTDLSYNLKIQTGSVGSLDKINISL